MTRLQSVLSVSLSFWNDELFGGETSLPNPNPFLVLGGCLLNKVKTNDRVLVTVLPLTILISTSVSFGRFVLMQNPSLELLGSLESNLILKLTIICLALRHHPPLQDFLSAVLLKCRAVLTGAKRK
jgi:hypothetical protein